MADLLVADDESDGFLVSARERRALVLMHFAIRGSEFQQQRVFERCRPSARAREPPFEMNWMESGLRDVTAPTSKAFGHAVIVEIVAAACDADVDVEFSACGFRWSLRSRSAETLNE